MVCRTRLKKILKTDRADLLLSIPGAFVSAHGEGGWVGGGGEGGRKVDWDSTLPRIWRPNTPSSPSITRQNIAWAQAMHL